MLPSARKLYLDIPSTSLLVDEIEQLKKRVATLTRDRDALMGKCEGFMAASRQYADKERSARMETLAVREASSQMQKKYEALKKAYEANIDRYVFLADEFAVLPTRASSSSQTPSSDRKRKSSCSSDITQASPVIQSGMKPTYMSQYATPRTKRALPKSSVASTSEESHGLPRFVRRRYYAESDDD